MPSDSHPSQITLAHSPGTGIIAIPSGEQHHRARTALEAAGFARRDDGTYAFPLADPVRQSAAVAELVDFARDHDVSVTLTARRYLGDIAERVARQLPGSWSARVEVYALPADQDNLADRLWDAGGLAEAVTTARIRYAAVLSDGRGTDFDLLVIERPGHDHEYLIGALAPTPGSALADEANAPRCVVVTGEPAHTAQAIMKRLLPVCRQALHARRISEVARALTRARTAERTWDATVRTRRTSDGTPLDDERLAGLEVWFRYRMWDAFQTFLHHGPALIDTHHTSSRATAVSSADAEALDRLRAALDAGARVHRGAPAPTPAEPPSAVQAQRTADAWPAIGTWLVDGHVLIDHALKSSTHQVPGPATALPPPPPRDQHRLFPF
ncbi:hypothetical protein OIE62_07645 [Streptomyces scopuliridis]|uniref:Uncharacterized protein n=1 Tax=Streptomyces scopuliridis TaxID=452529 RepID=A0ACD4ZTE0_9ACTN|nr:hypothetical protein [Streptomyces scopuliridis]WSC01561.1 hypothetical protein OG835_34175 [Streptomyces scopuliridis]WSC04901.1 hypothetical protein OIE62_07645 [Streptomyces scopuliridis]